MNDIIFNIAKHCDQQTVIALLSTNKNIYFNKLSLKIILNK